MPAATPFEPDQFLDRLNPQERTAALQHLTRTRENLLDAVHGLSDPQWRFQPSPDRWSIAGVVDHMAIIEELIERIVAGMPQAPQAEPGRNYAAIEGTILTGVPDRTKKLQAPPATHPSGTYGPGERLGQLLEVRACLLLLLDAPALRGHVIPHPLFGPWDGYQYRTDPGNPGPPGIPPTLRQLVTRQAASALVQNAHFRA